MEELGFSVIKIERRLKKMEREQEEKGTDPEMIALFQDILDALKIIREHKR